MNKFCNEEKLKWTQDSVFYAFSVFVAWRIIYKNRKSIQKEWVVVDIWDLNQAAIDDVYSLSQQEDIIASILECRYISIMNSTNFFYQWLVTRKDREKLTIVSYCELETSKVALISYKRFPLYAQQISKSIFWTHYRLKYPNSMDKE